MRAGLVVIEAWFKGYRGSPGLGGVRIAELSSLAGLQDYEDKIEDFVPCPDGTFLGVEGKLGNTDMWISYHCNRLCVTLALSGVYIKRRVFSP